MPTKTIDATESRRSVVSPRNPVVRARGDRHGLLRVLMVVESSAGGTGRHVLDLSEGLAARGCEVHLLYSNRRIDPLFLGRLAGIDAIHRATIPMRTGLHPSDLGVTRAVRRYARRHGPFDVIHGHSSKGGAIARLAALGTSSSAFYTLHGLIMMDLGLASWKRLFYLTIERALSVSTAGIIAVSPEEGRAAVRLGLGHSRVTTIPNGIGPGALATREEARGALGVDMEVPVIGFVGRLVSQKAPDVLIRAFARATRDGGDARLALVGSGPMESELRELSRVLGVSDRVWFLGERDARGLLAAFDVFALSSRKEGLPYVVLEAMSAGLPVVATSSGGVELLVEPGRNGIVVPPGDVEAFASALSALLDDPMRRKEFGLESADRASRFTVEAMVESTLAAYRRARSNDESDRSGKARPDPKASRRVPSDSTPLTPSSAESTPRGAPAMISKPRSAELHPGPGFRIRTSIPRLDASVMDQFREFATPDISDLLNRLYAVDPGVRGLTGLHHTLCGPACTVKVFPGDNLMVHKALDVARPGDVVVVDAGGARTNAVLGDLISAKAKHRKIAGFVVDGLVRDLPTIQELDFPVFARGTTPIGPLHRGPGEINFAISCGGIVVNPGDLIVADGAGVIVVPREIAPELLARLKSHKDANISYLAAVRRGEFSNAWVDRVLEDQQCYMSAGSGEGAEDAERAMPPVGTGWGQPWPTPGLDDDRLIDGANAVSGA